MPWLGYELTAEEELELVARGEAAKRWRASSGDERAARKRTRIVSGGYVSPLSRCGGNSWFYAAHSDSSYPQYRLAGKPPGCGLFRPAEAFPNVTAWHFQGGVPGIPEAEYLQFPRLQLGKRLELAAGGRSLEIEVLQHAFHNPALRELDSDGKPIGTDSPSTGWCNCSRGLVVRFYPIGCLLPLCCRANAVPNDGWLVAMARDDRILYCSSE